MLHIKIKEILSAIRRRKQNEKILIQSKVMVDVVWSTFWKPLLVSNFHPEWIFSGFLAIFYHNILEYTKLAEKMEVPHSFQTFFLGFSVLGPPLRGVQGGITLLTSKKNSDFFAYYCLAINRLYEKYRNLIDPSNIFGTFWGLKVWLPEVPRSF